MDTIRLTLCRSLFSLFVSVSITDITRLPRPGEIDGNDYHFITRDEMERAIQDGRFLDYMETSKGYLHGIAISSVKDVIDDGKVPVLDLLPQVCRIKPINYICGLEYNSNCLFLI